MKKAPFLFFPNDWFKFFSEKGWKPKDILYLHEESAKLKRAAPLPWFVKAGLFLIFWKKDRRLNKMAGYVMLTPNK